MDNAQHLIQRPDDMVQIDFTKLQLAFKTWREEVVERGTTNANERHRMFDAYVNRRRGLKNGSADKTGLPRSTTKWHQVKIRAEAGEKIFLRRDVCEQIFLMNGISVVKEEGNFQLFDQPINSTDLVTLGPVNFHQIDPGTGEGEVEVEWLQIEAGEWHEVSYSDFLENPEREPDADLVQPYGQVRYFLRNASISIQTSAYGNRRLNQLAANEKTELGKSFHIELRSDRRSQELRWMSSSPVGRDALQGSLESLILANVSPAVGEKIEVVVSASPYDLDAETSPLKNQAQSEDDLAQFKNNFRSQVFKNRLRDEGRIDLFKFSCAIVRQS